MGLPLSKMRERAAWDKCRTRRLVFARVSACEADDVSCSASGGGGGGGGGGIRARAVAKEGRGRMVDAEGILVNSVPAGDAGAELMDGVGGSGLRGGCRFR